MAEKKAPIPEHKLPGYKRLIWAVGNSNSQGGLDNVKKNSELWLAQGVQTQAEHDKIITAIAKRAAELKVK